MEIKLLFSSKGDKGVIMFPSGFIAKYDKEQNVISCVVSCIKIIVID